MMKRPRIFLSLLLVQILVVSTIVFIIWALRSPPHVQALLVRVVMVSLIIFLAILFLRYFALLWFAYLGHAERNVFGEKRAKELPPISIVVPAYNEAEVLEGAMASLAALDYPELEVLLVDDGSEDQTLLLATEWEGRHGNADFRIV